MIFNHKMIYFWWNDMKNNEEKQIENVNVMKVNGDSPFFSKISLLTEKFSALSFILNRSFHEYTS